MRSDFSLNNNNNNSKSMDQPGEVANPAHGQLTGKMNVSLSASAPENLISRDRFGSVPSCVSLLISILRLNLSGDYFLDSSRVPRRRPLFIKNRHTPSVQSRVYRITQMRTNDVHCRESAGTGRVNLKVVPNECCLGRSPWTNKYAPLFPTPTIGMK